MIESSLEADFEIVVRIARRQSNRFDIGIQLLGLDDDIKTIPVRQTAIAQEDMEAPFAQPRQRLRHVLRGDHGMAVTRQKEPESGAGFQVILDEKNVHTC